jgi:Fe-S-cluster containining protein
MVRMVFNCQQCGECCSVMGDVLSVLEKQGDDRYLLLNCYTGEKDMVRIDPDKLSLFLNANRPPGACPFLRHSQQTGLAYCTVHLTRPDMCRDFSCWRLLILDSSGKRAGRVMQRRFLASEDDTLSNVWETEIREIDEPDAREWDETVIKILNREGYLVIR